jgi:hypothetical protein
VALLVALALLVAGCSGPETGDPTTTAASGDGPTATVTTLDPSPADPTSTTTPAVTATSPATEPAGQTCDAGVDLLGYSDAFDKVTYEDTTVGGLSALAKAGDGSTYYALSDRGGRVYTLDFPVPGDPTITSTFQLRDGTGEPYGENAIDSEGIAVLPNGDLLVSSEVEPSIREYTPDGTHVTNLDVPEKFLVQPEGRATGNETFESLALSPSGQHLFTAVERPLDWDGATAEGQGRVRILRYDLTDGTFQPAAEYLYLSEQDQGVSEIVAVSDTELLVLERGLSFISGFSARVFRVSLDGADDVSTIDRLEDTSAQPVTKDLLVDIADCPTGDNSAFGGISALMDNFESMALGPQLPDGRQSLIVGSDDNFRSFEVTRYLVFAIDSDRF